MNAYWVDTNRKLIIRIKDNLSVPIEYVYKRLSIKALDENTIGEEVKQKELDKVIDEYNKPN
jgi:hypothetical protein